jgi:alanine racemase
MDLKNLRPTRAEINLDNLEHNVREIKRIVKPNTAICTVVKADGYGHGAFNISKTVLSSGASYLAVAILDEAIELRQKGIKAPILVLGYTPEDQFNIVIENEITQTIFSLRSAEILSRYATLYNKTARVHIKLDTGMSRLGFQAELSSIPFIEKIFRLDGLRVEGIYTHFAKADEADKSFTKEQFRKFIEITKILKNRGFNAPLLHAANSAALIDLTHMHLQMVRPGIILYGIYPSNKVNKKKIKLKPVMSFRTRVAHIKTLSRGRAVSYGGTYVTTRQSIIATLPVGYADGYARSLSSRAEVLIKGQRAPVIGRICMDQCMVDVTDVHGSVEPGEDVVLFGEMGKEKISAEEIAEMIGTIGYEVVCSISKRVPRVYIKEQNIIKIKQAPQYTSFDLLKQMTS